MKFTFKNLGPIKDAELELGELTIIAGRNNTGKTYIAHALYGFLDQAPLMVMGGAACTSFFESHFRNLTDLTISEIVDMLLDRRTFEWKLSEEEFLKGQAGLVRALEQDFSYFYIDDVFRVSADELEGAELRAEFSGQPPIAPHRSEFYVTRGYGLAIEFDNGHVIVQLSERSRHGGAPDEAELPSHLRLFNTFKLVYAAFLLNRLAVIRNFPFILPSTRHSAPLFYKDIDFARSQATQLQWHKSADKNGEPGTDEIPSSELSPYPLPVRDNLDFSRQMTTLAEMRSNRPKSEIVRDIAAMLGGDLVGRDDQVRFVANEGQKFDIPIHFASSSVREMSHLYFYLGYKLSDAQVEFLIIDEPESHLDTANQIQFARLLVRLVNSGIVVLITTHSDYILKEINNLIMLNSGFERKEEIIKRLGYRDTDKISPDQIRAYTVAEGRLRNCRVKDVGVVMPVFDETIRSINMTARELFMLIQKEREENKSEV